MTAAGTGEVTIEDFASLEKLPFTRKYLLKIDEMEDDGYVIREERFGTGNKS